MYSDLQLVRNNHKYQFKPTPWLVNADAMSSLIGWNSGIIKYSTWSQNLRQHWLPTADCNRPTTFWNATRRIGLFLDSESCYCCSFCKIILIQVGSQLGRLFWQSPANLGHIFLISDFNISLLCLFPRMSIRLCKGYDVKKCTFVTVTCVLAKHNNDDWWIQGTLWAIVFIFALLLPHIRDFHPDQRKSWIHHWWFHAWTLLWMKWYMVL